MSNTKNHARGTFHTVLPWTLFAVTLLVFLVYAFMSSDRANSVATVGKESVSKNELYDLMVEKVGPQALDQIITEKLIYQQADKKNIKVTDQDVQAELDNLKAGFPSEEEFEFALMSSGMTLEQVKEQMKPQVMVSKLMEPEITLTDDEVKAYFDENKESFEVPEQIEASHILVATQEEAEAVLTQLKNGGDFAALAKEKSTDPSKDQGGALGKFAKGKMVAEFDEAAFKLEKNGLSEVVKTEFGYHIIKVTEKFPKQEADYEKDKEKARKQLFTSKVSEKYDSWLETLRTEIAVTTKL